MIEQLIAGFGNALTVTNLLFIAAGITLGIVIGVIPGLGSVTALAVLIPITFYMSPLAAIAFLVGVNKGGTSGGAIPAILLNSPGTPEAAATALDGHPMAKRGESQRALKFALFSSVTGDTISDLLLIVLVVPFAAIALEFGPLEYTAVLLFRFRAALRHLRRFADQGPDRHRLRRVPVDCRPRPGRRLPAHGVRRGRAL